MKLFKVIMFSITFFSFNVAHAYFLKGVRATVLIENKNNHNFEEVLIEGCSKNNCSNIENNSKCIEEKPQIFFCYLKEQHPSFVRFKIKFKENKFLNSKFIQTNGYDSLSNFKIVITNNELDLKATSEVF